jgi:hypothetical protein
MYSITPGANKTIVSKEGDTKDIIAFIMKADKMAAPYTRDFAQSIPEGTINETCKWIWKWVRSHIDYVEDPSGVQYIQLPGQLYMTRKGDCKSMTLFTASVIYNLYGDIYCYRFISQDRRADLHHVYLVVFDENGEEIILDCVEDEYGVEVPHEKQKDMYPGNKNIGSLMAPTPLQLLQGAAALNNNPSTQQLPMYTGTQTGTYAAAQTYTSPTSNVPTDTAPGMSTGTMLVGGAIVAGLLYLFLKD